MKYGEDKVVTPMRRKGEASLWLIHESVLVFRWKSILYDGPELVESIPFSIH